ncbi:MAG: LysM peptidoglycan-binding domain-containing protein [Chloroflexota bacterium]
MRKSLSYPVVISLLLCAALVLAACTRSATTPTVPETADGLGGGPSDDAAATQAFDATTNAFMAALLAQGETQTSAAATAGTPQVVATTAVPAGGATNTPTAAVVATTPAPAATGPRQYTVKAGDWLYKIARENGVSPEALIAANPKINPNAVLVPGTVLTIPGSSTPVPGSTTTGQKTYVVKGGDNLFRIALNNGTTYQTLAQLNNIPAPYTVYPGQVLKLP